MKKPLSITSPDHAVALSMYAVLGISGFLGTVRVSRNSGITQAMSEPLADVWSVTLMLAGFTALASAFFTKRSLRPEHSLEFEKYACATIALSMGWLIYIVLVHFGDRGFQSLTSASVFAIGAALRVWQIHTGQRLLKQARCNPTVSDNRLLADPREDDARP